MTRCCSLQCHLKESPAEHLVTRRPPRPKPVALSVEQARALLSAPNLSTFTGLRDRAVLGLYLEQKASPHSVARLSLGDFQPDTGALLLKARKRRIVCLGAGLLADFERYLRLGRAGVAKPAEQAFFVTQSGARMGGQNALQILKRYFRLVGVPKPTLQR